MKTKKYIGMIVIGLMLICILFLSGRFFYSMVSEVFTSETMARRVANLMADICVLTFLYASYKLLHRFDCKMPVGKLLQKPEMHVSVLSLLGMGFAMLLVQGIANIASCFMGIQLHAQQVSMGYAGLNAWEICFVLLSISVATPITEEVIFRGLIFRGLNGLVRLPVAIFLSGFIFGFLHGNSLFTVAATAAAGMMLAYVYVAYGNLSSVIIGHGIYNFVVTARSILSEDMVLGAGTSGSIHTVSISIVMIVFCGLVCKMIVEQIKKDMR